MGKIVITARIELDDEYACGAPPGYLEQLLDPANWNDVPIKNSEVYDDLRSALINVRTINEIEIVSVRQV